MVRRRSLISRIMEIFGVILTVFTHWVIFYFAIINAAKSNREASKMSLSLPTDFQLWENIKYIVTYRNYQIISAFWNSFKITFFTMAIVISTASMAAFILQRRKSSPICKASDMLIVACLTVPASVIPTYYVLRLLGLANTLAGLIFVEVALLFPFCTMMYKSFVATIPKEIDEAALLDGCSSFRLFWKIIFPILKPITSSILVLRSIVVFNDFQNPQYYLSGGKNMTIQVCVYVFKSAFGTKWGYLFTASILASLPLLILYAFMHKNILEGMTSGSVKG